MAPKTRSATKAQPKRIKFTDDDEILDLTTPEPKPQSDVEDVPSEESESDSDSDEAPEEESISALKAKTLKQQKEQEKLAQELKKQEKQKRKEQDLIYQQQQQEKKKRLEEIMNSSKLPDLLPDELLESIGQPNGDQAQPKGKHMRSEELEEEYAEMKKKAKLEKLKQLKQQRTQAVKKGPVHVQVQTFGEKKKSVPRADPKVLESKNSWLNRDSLRRK